jgi:PLP dependent protein
MPKTSPHDSANPSTSATPQKLSAVRQNIAQAIEDAGRAAGEVTLVCVTKTFDAPDIVPVLEAGERVFGENRVQEAQKKWPELRAAYPDVQLHLIGPLQSNKVSEAVALFDVIETVDRPKIAQALADEMRKTGKSPRLYVQVNIGSEPQKAGILPEEADAFIAQCRDEYGLVIAGLMCIPPADQQASPYFALLNQIARRNKIRNLSMGMSADFELAIQLGATHVRLGSAIFGTR